MKCVYAVLMSFLLVGCASSSKGGVTDGASGSGATASVSGVAVTGAPGAYQFDVTINSPDTGCSSYADWWEVVRPDGQLLYRRVLAHSHVKEQPFTRTGGPIAIDPDDQVIVRAHMAGGAGYGGTAFSGSPSVGFSADDTIDASWHPELAKAEPRPKDCDF